MSIRKIYQYPAPVLRQKAARVEKFDENLQKLIADMAETMYDAPGIGLAAPQIGESLQLLVVHIGNSQEDRQYKAFINPIITEAEGNQIDEEGCLSVPELTANVQRHRKISLTYQDEEGNMQELSTEDRFAVVLQHEIDHLNGILFIDHLSPLKRNLYKKKIKKAMTAAKEPA
ncbi:MAG: peptide deformylase [Desulfopila sp.]|jgi:peptide deformylase|nr:peptide deformylase [Desulfopila sp.]